MKILFNLLTTIEIPDADKFPPKEDVEKQLIDFFMSEGMLTYGLEITNYCAPAEEAERRTDAVKALPSAQPEIVRCKDCIYYNSDCVDAPYGLTRAIYWCDLHYDAVYDNLAVNPDDFCSRAERRSDGQNQS